MMKKMQASARFKRQLSFVRDCPSYLGISIALEAFYMRLKRYIPVFAALSGVVGAVLRGLNLRSGYEVGTGLPIAGNAPQTALVVLSVAVAVLFFLASHGFVGRRGASFEDAFACASTGYKTVAVLCGLAMGAAGAGGLYLLATGADTAAQSLLEPQTPTLSAMLPLIPLWLLALLSMAAFIVLASVQAQGTMTEKRAAFTLVPMFWACFDLIITFKDNGASPFVSLYAFELFAAIALVFAFYSIAGFLYARSNPARFVFTASLGVFFSFTCVGGYLVYALLGGGAIVLTAEAVLRYLCFGAASVYLLANLALVSRRLDYAPRH